MLDMWDEDVNAIMAADARLTNVLARFRGTHAGASATGAGAHEDGVRVSGGTGDGGAGGDGVVGDLGGTQGSSGRRGKDVQGPSASP
jgi:hypothetical protein